MTTRNVPFQTAYDITQAHVLCVNGETRGIRPNYRYPTEFHRRHTKDSECGARNWDDLDPLPCGSQR